MHIIIIYLNNKGLFIKKTKQHLIELYYGGGLIIIDGYINPCYAQIYHFIVSGTEKYRTVNRLPLYKHFLLYYDKEAKS